MSIFSNVTEQDLINLRKLAQQQKNQRTLKIKNRNIKQTHDMKLLESLSPITKNLDTINESSKKTGEVFTESRSNGIIIRALPNNSNSSKSMREMIGSIMNSRKSLKTTQDEFDQANNSGIPFQISGGDTKKYMIIFMIRLQKYINLHHQHHTLVRLKK